MSNHSPPLSIFGDLSESKKKSEVTLPLSNIKTAKVSKNKVEFLNVLHTLWNLTQKAKQRLHRYEKKVFSMNPSWEFYDVKWH